MQVLLLLLFASHISASVTQASPGENSNATSNATERRSVDLAPQTEPARCWRTDLNESFCSSVEACHLHMPECDNSCHKISSVLLHNLIVLYARKDYGTHFADNFRHDPFVSDDGGSCGELARETFKTLTYDDREYYTSSDCNAVCSYSCRTVRYTEELADALNDKGWLGVLLFECDSFPMWLLGLLVGIACTLLGVSIGVGACCFYIKRRKKAIDKEDPRTGTTTDPLRVHTIDVTAPTSSDFRLHKARSSPRRSPGLAKSPALPVAKSPALRVDKSPRLPVAKKPKGTSILPETPIATRTALPGIDADDRERAKKQKPKSTTAKSPNDKTEVDDPEIKASAPSLRSPHRSGSG
ncbi:hypothetical protein AAVH_20634 [Aphelenchoides avenae]|nr:hypothetical protein AAVH_20634 [Aphelenchus avenae]